MHHEKLPKLTNGGDNRDGKVEGAGEFPLSAGAMGLSLQHYALDFAVVVLRKSVLFLHLAALLLQDATAGALRLRLQRVEDGGADEQVGEHAEDERQGPDVLLLHPWRRRRGRISAVTGDAAFQREGATSAVQPVA